MKKKLLAILLTMAMVVTMLPAAFVTVTAEDGDVNLYPDNTVVEVGTAEEWKGNVAAGKNIKLTADITLEGAPLYTFYGGVIDGDGHTITVNYTIGADDTAFSATQWPKIGGLFTRLYGCTIKDLTVAGTVSLAKDVTTSDTDPVEIGGIAGTVDGTVAFVNVTSTVNVTVTDAETNLVAGGFFGYTSRNNTGNTCSTTPKVTMKDCVYNGTVSVCGGSAGGFIGKNISTTTLTNCVAKGTVTANKTKSNVGGILGRVAVATDASMTMVNCDNQANVKDGIFMGGMIGLLDTSGDTVCNTTLRGCKNNGDVISELPTSTGWPSVGGMIGETGWAKCDLDVVDCVNYGKVASYNNNGGIMGSCKIDDVLTDGDYTVKNCVNSGNVYSLDGGQAGGIIQYIASATVRLEGCVNLQNSANTASFSGIVLNAKQVTNLELIDCVNYGNLTGSSIGGILTKTVCDKNKDTGNYDSPCKNITIKGCVNYGNLNGKNQVGGILTTAGEVCNNITIDGCVNYGDISMDTSYQWNYAGGIIGDVKNCGKLEVKNSANYGTVQSKRGYIGGIAGALHTVNSAVFEDCFNYGTVLNTVTGTSEEGVAGIINRLDQAITLNITRCHNFGKLSTNVWGWTKAGGILATAQNANAVMEVNITNCSNFGTFEIYDYSGRTSDNNYRPEIGGISGTCNAMKADGSKFNVVGCYSNGVVVESDKAKETRTTNTGWNYNFEAISAISTAAGANTKSVKGCASAYLYANSKNLTAQFGIDTSGNIKIDNQTDLATVVATLGSAFVLDDGQIEPVYALNKAATQIYATQEASAGEGNTVDIRVLALVNSLGYDLAGVKITAVNGTAVADDKGKVTTTTVYTGVKNGDDDAYAPYGTYYLPITLKGISNSGTFTVTLKSFVEKDGTTTDGATYTVTVTDGAVVSAKKKLNFPESPEWVTPAAPPTGDEYTHVMSYNLLVGNKNKAAVVALITAQSPDIFGVQEANKDWYDYLTENLPDDYAVLGFGRGSESTAEINNNDEGCYVFYRKSKFNCEETKTYWLSDTPEIKSKVSGEKDVDVDQYYRIVTFAKLTRISDGKALVFCNTHLDLYAAARQKQVAILLNFMEPYLQEGLPVVITGDFNMASSETAAFGQFATEGFQSAAAVALNKGSTVATFPSSNAYIDYIMCSDNMEVNYYSVVTDPSNSSDHRPIGAWIKY